MRLLVRCACLQRPCLEAAGAHCCLLNRPPPPPPADPPLPTRLPTAPAAATAGVPMLASTLPGLFLSRALVGLGEGVAPSAATDLVARSIPTEQRSRAISFIFGGLHVGRWVCLGGWMGGRLVRGWVGGCGWVGVRAWVGGWVGASLLWDE